MHENVYVIKVHFAGLVDLYAVKAHSQEEAIAKFRGKLEKQQINPNVYHDVYVRMLAEDVEMIDSYQAGS
jgi:hypothetical protein